MIEKQNELWYVSQPSRLGGAGKEAYREKILQELIARGYDVIHPFNAFPYAHFEGNSAIGRNVAMEYCCDLVGMCGGRVLVTGISEGVLIEVEYALRNHPNAQIRAFAEYDPEWHVCFQQFKKESRYLEALEAVALVNPQADA